MNIIDSDNDGLTFTAEKSLQLPKPRRDWSTVTCFTFDSQNENLF